VSRRPDVRNNGLTRPKKFSPTECGVISGRLVGDQLADDREIDSTAVCLECLGGDTGDQSHIAKTPGSAAEAIGRDRRLCFGRGFRGGGGTVRRRSPCRCRRCLRARFRCLWIRKSLSNSPRQASLNRSRSLSLNRPAICRRPASAAMQPLWALIFNLRPRLKNRAARSSRRPRGVWSIWARCPAATPIQKAWA
jgi:hypothetical protein